MIILIINLLFTIYEVLHIIKGVKAYFSDPINLQDILRVLSLSFYCTMRLFDLLDNNVNDIILSVVTILSWIRGITFMRVIARARWLIRMIIEIIEDMYLFLVLLFILNCAFSMIFFIGKDV